jgi:hypothetical protein
MSFLNLASGQLHRASPLTAFVSGVASRRGSANRCQPVNYGIHLWEAEGFVTKLEF